MIMGTQETIHSVCLAPEEGPDDFRKKLEEEISQLDDFVIFADLMGGTPCNVAARLLMEGKAFELYAGMNMPMVIGFLNSILLNEAIDFVDFGATNIHHLNPLLGADDEDEE